MPAIEECLALLQAGAPGQRTGTGFDRILQRDYARLDLDSTTTLKFAYLYSGSLVVEGARALNERPDGITLALYPSDTLTQARALYSNPDRVEGLIGLRERGWELRANFHFGYIEKGFIWTTSTLDIESYLAYWTQPHRRLHAYPREEWDTELARLIADGIFSASDEPQFDADFRETKREQVYPRPAVAVTRSWAEPEAGAIRFPSELRAALREVLTALREPLTTVEPAERDSRAEGAA